MKKNWIPIALFTSIVFLVFVFEFTPKKLPSPPASEAKQARYPVFFINDIETHQFDERGRLAHRFTANAAKHFQDDPKKPGPNDFTEIEAPAFNFYKTDAEPWHLTAKHGLATQDGDKLVLSDSVTAWQQIEAGETRIDTVRLSLFPTRQFAESDKTVIIHYPRATYQGEGLEVDFKEQVFTLLANVKGTHAPPVRDQLNQARPQSAPQP